MTQFQLCHNNYKNWSTIVKIRVANICRYVPIARGRTREVRDHCCHLSSERLTCWLRRISTEATILFNKRAADLPVNLLGLLRSFRVVRPDCHLRKKSRAENSLIRSWERRTHVRIQCLARDCSMASQTERVVHRFGQLKSVGGKKVLVGGFVIDSWQACCQGSTPARKWPNRFARTSILARRGHEPAHYSSIMSLGPGRGG